MDRHKKECYVLGCLTQYIDSIPEKALDELIVFLKDMMSTQEAAAELKRIRDEELVTATRKAQLQQILDNAPKLKE